MGRFNKYSGGVVAERSGEKKDLLSANSAERLWGHSTSDICGSAVTVGT